MEVGSRCDDCPPAAALWKKLDDQYDRAVLFDGLDVWRDADMRHVTGTIPVIKVTFGGVKGGAYAVARALVVTKL